MNSLEAQIKLFTGEIINKSNNANVIKKNVFDYKTFLINTKLISENSEISKWLDIVINSCKIIADFKELHGSVNIDAFVESMTVYDTKRNEVLTDHKHYGHYHSNSSFDDETYSNSCGSSSYSSSCGSSSYSDSCGSGYQRRISSSSCGGSVVTSRC